MESLSREEFHILQTLEASLNGFSCLEDLEKSLEGPQFDTQGVWEQLLQKSYVEDFSITAKGVEALEPFRVRRAVFLAAGFGSRLIPVTLQTPKPLISVKGIRMIETLMDALKRAGIEDFVIVRGYKAEQFDELLLKYPNIRFIENPEYNEANNVVSALLARNELCNAYVLEADLIVNNPKVIRKYHYGSDFLAFQTEFTNDWCFEVENGIIRSEKLGGRDCYQMVGISYWDEKAGKQLAADLVDACNQPGGREFYWEQIPMSEYRQNYEVNLLECKAGDVIEIDTFRELQQVDASYLTWEAEHCQ